MVTSLGSCFDGRGSDSTVFTAGGPQPVWGASWTLMTWEAAPSDVSKDAEEGDNWHAWPLLCSHCLERQSLSPFTGEQVKAQTSV